VIIVFGRNLISDIEKVLVLFDSVVDLCMFHQLALGYSVVAQ